VGDDGSTIAGPTLAEIYGAVRNGFSSVRREMTRSRAELVVVKAQAASALRRMDGLAATADGSDAGNGAVLQRLTLLEAVLKQLGDRLPEPRGEAADGTGAGNDSVRVIQQIKVCFWRVELLSPCLRKSSIWFAGRFPGAVATCADVVMRGTHGGLSTSTC